MNNVQHLIAAVAHDDAMLQAMRSEPDALAEPLNLGGAQLAALRGADRFFPPEKPILDRPTAETVVAQPVRPPLQFLAAQRAGTMTISADTGTLLPDASAGTMTVTSTSLTYVPTPAGPSPGAPSAPVSPGAPATPAAPLTPGGPRAPSVPKSTPGQPVTPGPAGPAPSAPATPAPLGSAPAQPPGPGTGPVPAMTVWPCPPSRAGCCAQACVAISAIAAQVAATANVAITAIAASSRSRPITPTGATGHEPSEEAIDAST